MPDGGWVLPAVIDPPERFCFQIEVPNDRQHIAAFVGALWDLQFWFNWQRDEAHTALAVGNVWRGIINQAVDQMNAGFSCNDVTPIVTNTEVDLTQPCDFIRWSEDGVLQVLCCGEWTDVPGTEFAPARGQPEGQPPPSYGDCYEVEVALTAGEYFILPFSIKDGDTVEITNVQGIWSDEAGIFWWYGNGDNYVLGLRLPDCDHKVGDLDATLCHMELMALIGGSTYVSAYNTTITIAPGTGVQSLQFVANNGFAHPSGTITFHVKVCNGSAPPAPVDWTHVFDFVASESGWYVAETTPQASGVYDGGLGWRQNNPAVSDAIYIWSPNMLPVGVVKALSIEADATFDGSNPHMFVHLSTGVIFDEGGDHPSPWNIDLSSNTLMWPNFGIRFDPNVGSVDSWPHYITKITVSGTGSDPFI